MKEEWNPNDYQGKRKSQVEGSYYNFIVAGAVLILTIALVILDKLLS